MSLFHLLWVIPYTGIATLVMSDLWNDNDFLGNSFMAKVAIFALGVFWLPFLVFSWLLLGVAFFFKD